MARDEKPIGKGRVKFRFIEVEMEGSDQTLQNAIREITQSVGRPHVVVKSVAALPSARGNGGAAAEVTGTIADVEDAEVSVTEETEPNESEDDKPPAEGKARKWRPRTPKIVPIELREGEIPLRDFLKSAPDSLNDRYTLIAFWFKAHRAIGEITADHIFTAYREMDWTNFPKDVGQPLRALKVLGWFDKGEGDGAYAINHIGDGKARDLIRPKDAT
jgi:hypothetical protein